MIEQFYLTHTWTLSGATTSDQGGPGSNGKKGVLYIPSSSRIGTSSSDNLVSYLGHSLAVCIFYSASWLSCGSLTFRHVVELVIKQLM